MFRYIIVMVIFSWVITGTVVLKAIERDQPVGVLLAFIFPLVATIVGFACIDKEDSCNKKDKSVFHQ